MASALRSTAIRFLPRGGSRDYENTYPVRGWSGDGPRRRGDELSRRSAATLVAAALRLRGRSYDPGGVRNREGTHRGDGSIVWVRRRRSVRPARGATVAWPFPANQRVSVFGFGSGGEEGAKGKCGELSRSARRLSRTQAVVGGEHGLQQAPALRRDCRGGAGIGEPGAVGLALSLRASALAGGSGSGLARRAARPALPGAASAVQKRVSGFADGGSGIGFAQGGGRGGRLRRSGLVGIGQRATVLDWPRRLRWSEPRRGRESAGTASALCSLGTAGFAGRGWRSVASRRCSGRERDRGRARERQLQQGRIYSVSIGVRRHR
uniref:Uncharacterized protein n=1 Tax=Oryza barthii TaxID=65489 RepID=A0A0D3F4P8_9ORYZ